MRPLLPVVIGILLVLSTACTEGGLDEPIPLPVLPAVTQLPPATVLPAATPLPPATESPTVSLPKPATALPEVTSLQAATKLPTAEPLPTAVSAPTATELPTAEPAPVAPLLPTMAPDVPTPDMSQPQVAIGDSTWYVELAVTPAERSQGLSGREKLPEASGMLFVFEGDQHLAFWMPDMNFPLDMVWIDSTCQVVDVTLNAPVPLPGQSLSDLSRFSPSVPSKYVLEINAGEFHDMGISVGDSVRFGGAIEGQHGC